MKKYKMCLFCKTYNPSELFECINCGANLMKVEETIKTDTFQNANNIKNDMENYNDLDKFNVVSGELKIHKKNFLLNSIDKIYKYKISKPVCIIGRENEMKQYLLSKSYVSRTHAKIILANDELYITNLSKTNYTYLNNIKLEDNTPYLLKDNDEIGLGGMLKNNVRQAAAAYFIVRIEESTIYN